VVSHCRVPVLHGQIAWSFNRPPSFPRGAAALLLVCQPAFADKRRGLVIAVGPIRRGALPTG